MNMHLPVTLPALMLCSTLAVAGQAYTWTDASGTTHFSETPPPGTTPGVQPLDLLPAPAPGPYVNDYFSVINQARRMEARRLENERLATERLKAEAELQRARAEAQAVRQMETPPAGSEEDTRYYPVWPLHPGYGYRQRPGYGRWPHKGKPVWHGRYGDYRRSYRPKASLGQPIARPEPRHRTR